MNQETKALKLFIEDLLEDHKKIRRILEEINCAYKSFLYSPLFKKLNLDEFEKRLEKRLRLKEQKL